MKEEEIDLLRSRVLGTGEHLTYKETREAAKEYVRRRRQLSALTPGDGLEHRWSDTATWGGLPVPSAADTDIVYIPAGTTLLLDESVYIRFWVVEGVLKVPADVGKDLQLESEAIIINGADGKFLVGNEAAPHPHKFHILLHGTRGTQTLPKFGIKTVAMTDGELYLRGKTVTPTWALLDETAHPTNRTIKVQGDTNWQIGDEIVIAGTGIGSEASCTLKRTDDKCESEGATITGVVRGASQTTLTLDRPLNYTHWGYTRSSHGETFEARAEVLHLTRSIRIKGTENDPSFGSHVMALRGKVNLLYVETTFAGQSYSLGRYPFHIHTVGQPKEQLGSDQSLSNIVGCAIHHTFNRAITAHACHNLNIKRNVAYNSLGHQFFIEDGIETGNTYTENVALMAHRAFSLLNTDQTPANFWITNPNNNFIRNRACGSHDHGFWFDAPFHPTGPSATTAVYCKHQPLGTFEGNVALSSGVAGYWVTEVDPTSDGKPRNRPWDGVLGSPRRGGLWLNNVAWANGEMGISFVGGIGHITVRGWKFASNGHTDMEFINIQADRWWSAENPEAFVVDQNVFFHGVEPRPKALNCMWKLPSQGAHWILPNGTDIGINGPGIVGRSGTCAFMGPAGGYVTVKDTKFIDYTYPPIKNCGDGCGGPGGYEVRFQGTQFPGMPEGAARVTFDARMGNYIRDMDGTISGTGTESYIMPSNLNPRTYTFSKKPNATMEDHMLAQLPPDSCFYSKVVHHNVCDASKVRFKTLQFRRKNGPVTNTDVTMENQYGQVMHKFYMYDAQGIRFNNHITLPFRLNTTAPIVNHLKIITGAAWQNPSITGVSRSEMRDLMNNEWAVLKMSTTDLPAFYRTWSFDWHAQRTNKYRKLDKNEATFNASWAGFNWKDHMSGDWAYTPNLTNPLNIGWMGEVQILLSGKHSVADDGAMGFDGPHKCYKADGVTETNECAIDGTQLPPCPLYDQAAKDAGLYYARPGDAGMTADRCFHQPRAVSEDHCESFCRRNNMFYGCRAYVWYTRQRVCRLLRQDAAGAALYTGLGEYDFHPITKYERGARIMSRRMPSMHIRNPDLEYFSGAKNSHPVCEGGEFGNNCGITPRQPFSYGTIHCYGDDCLGPMERCIDVDEYKEFPQIMSGDPPATFSWCDPNPVDHEGVPLVNWTVPVDGQDVAIAEKWTVYLDSTCSKTARVRHLDIFGHLEIRDGGNPNIVLTASSIFIGPMHGKLTAGSPAAPFEGHFKIEMPGNLRTLPAWGNPYSLAKRKWIIVLGTLSLHGKLKSAWTRLAKDASANATAITVAMPPDETFGETYWFGAKIAIAPTEARPFPNHMTFDARTVTAAQKRYDPNLDTNVLELTLDQKLSYEHKGPRSGEQAGLPGAEVGFIEKVHEVAGKGKFGMNIEIVGTDPDDPPDAPMGNGIDQQELGVHIGIYEADRKLGCQNSRFQGQGLFDGVKFTHCGQASTMAPCIQYAGAWNKRTVRNHMGEQVDLTANDGVGVPFVGSKMYVHRSSFEHTYSTGIATGRYKFSGRCNRPVGAAEEDYDCTMDMDGTGPRGVPNGQEFSGNTFFNTTTGAGAIASSGQRFKIYNNLVILVHDRRADYMKLIGSCGLRVTVAKPGRNPLPGQMRLAYFRDNVVAGAKFRGIIVPGFPCEWLDTEQEQLVEDFGPNYAHHCAIGLLVKGGAQKPGRNLVPGGDGHPSDHGSTRSPAEAYAPQPISGTNTYCSAVQNQVSYENRAYGFVIPCGGGRAYWIRDMYLVANKLNAAFWQTNGNAKAFKLGQRDAHVRFYRSTVVGTGKSAAIATPTALARPASTATASPSAPTRSGTRPARWAGP